MSNVYFHGEKVFLYTKFVKDLSIITETYLLHNPQATADYSQANEKGVYINGVWISLKDLLGYNYDQYWSAYTGAGLLDQDSENTYVNMSNYHSNKYKMYKMSADEDMEYEHTVSNVSIAKSNIKGTDYYGVTKYIPDEEEPQQSEEEHEEDTEHYVLSHSVQVRILHDEDGTIYEDLPWTDMETVNNEEFFYNYIIPFGAFTGQYQVIYKSEYTYQEVKTGIEDTKTAYTDEIFYVISRNEKYVDTVKIIGNVYHTMHHVPIEDTRVFIINYDTNEVYQSMTDREGRWEAYIYPGTYKFVFEHSNYTSEEIVTDIGDEQRELNFQNVVLKMENEEEHGTGTFHIIDKYIQRNGLPLHGLNVTAYSTDNPNIIIAKNITNDTGTWELYLDEGLYLLKVQGEAFNKEYDKTFRLKVDSEGHYFFEDISNNLVTDKDIANNSSGNGSSILEDTLVDKHGNPIVNVQVNAYLPNTTLSDDTIIAQDYTDLRGHWSLKLNPGEYVIEYYHPNYKTITETRVVADDI